MDTADQVSDGETADIDDYASLTSEAGEYVFENGRRYHGYKAGRYMVPNDEHEMDREDMKHHIAMLTTQGRLHLAPVNPNPENILDIGTGTGIWAISMADTYPDAQVIGTDLSPIQPIWIPPNMIVEVDDAEDRWLYQPNSIDFVHVRFMFFGIRNWSKLVRQAMRALKPGGWIELTELHVVPESPDGTMPDPCQIKEFSSVIKPVAAEVGLDIDVAQKFKGYLEMAGYEDVQEVVYELPIGDWPSDRRMKEMGRYHLFQFTGGLQAIGQAILTRVAGWTKEQVEVFLAGVRREGNNRNVHLYHKMYFVYGRKPVS